MNDIPPLGWVVLVCVGVIVVVMNVGLIGLLRYRPTLKMSAKDQPRSRSAESWQKMGDFMTVLRDPFAKQRSQLEQLSREVAELEKKDPGSEDETKPPSFMAF